MDYKLDQKIEIDQIKITKETFLTFLQEIYSVSNDRVRANLFLRNYKLHARPRNFLSKNFTFFISTIRVL